MMTEPEAAAILSARPSTDPHTIELEAHWWAASGLTAADMVGYLDAGCYDARSAYELDVVGVAPAMAGAIWRDGVTYGQAVSDCDITAEWARMALVEGL